jgi:hypothetical protein
MGEHVWGRHMLVGTGAVDHFIQPRRQVSIRRDEEDLCCSRKISLFFRNANASALRKACHFLRWEVVNDAAA